MVACIGKNLRVPVGIEPMPNASAEVEARRIYRSYICRKGFVASRLAAVQVCGANRVRTQVVVTCSANQVGAVRGVWTEIVERVQMKRKDVGRNICCNEVIAGIISGMREISVLSENLAFSLEPPVLAKPLDRAG